MDEIKEEMKEGQKTEISEEEFLEVPAEIDEIKEIATGAAKEQKKKEIQGTIIPIQTDQRASEEEFFSALKTISPGTNFRTAIDGAQRTGKGALIVIENENVLPLIDGGFRINTKFTPQKLIELTKMDGAIILSKDMKKINYANVLLAPDNKIKTAETGTRHKAAERTAKQTGSLVIAISERKNEITLFYKNIRHQVRGTDEIRRKVNEQIQIIEKHRELFDQSVEKLDRLELRNYPSINQAINSIQKGRMILKIAEELRRFVIELGNEGAVLKARLRELTAGIEKEINFIIKDYTKLDVKKSRLLIDTLSYDEILDSSNITKALAYESLNSAHIIRGWRILSKTSIPESDIAQVIKSTGNLGEVLHSNVRLYYHLFGQEKATQLKEEIERMKLNVH